MRNIVVVKFQKYVETATSDYATDRAVTEFKSFLPKAMLYAETTKQVPALDAMLEVIDQVRNRLLLQQQCLTK